MSLPAFVRRALRRLAVGGGVALLAAWAWGWAAERSRFGVDAGETRARIEADARQRFDAFSARLQVAMAAARPDADRLRQAEQAETVALRSLFDAVRRGAGDADDLAVTVFGSSSAPVAWAGRPGDIPESRVKGGPALFLSPGAQGLRLVGVAPVVDAGEGGRRVGTVVAEVALDPSAATAVSSQGFTLPTRVAPVTVRPRFEGATEPTPTGFVVNGADGQPLAAIDIPAGSVERARQTWRRQARSAWLALAAVVVLLFAGPLLDWRRVSRSVRVGARTTVAIAVLLLTARVLCWLAVRDAGFADQPLAPALMSSWIGRALLASPADFFATSLFLAALVALAGSTFDLWRTGRRTSLPAWPVSGVVPHAAFLLTHLAAGAVVAALVFEYEGLLREGLARAPVDVLQFGLRPFEAPRLAIVGGLVVLHAAIISFAVFVLRLALSPWIFPHAPAANRVRAVAAWLAPGVLVVASGGTPAPAVPALLALAFIAVSAYVLGRYRTWLRHASQAATLVTYFAAVVLPSIVFYPSLVDAAWRARHDQIETRYAPEVTNQRRDLQRRLADALAQIDRIDSLPDLVRAVDSPGQGPPPTDEAFVVWSSTALAGERITSSVELYNTSGALVSRFALKLPEINSGQTWTESSCQWELFEEVSPFFAEERRLLHAGRAICLTGATGQVRHVGSIVVHLTLDYSNLSFVSAQSPYVALLRSGRPDANAGTAGAPVALSVYGWSRQALYTSTPTTWPLDEAVFVRAMASRDPFWAAITSDERPLDAYVLNDRSAIYVLSLERQTAFGHLIVVAELVTLAFVLFVAGVLAAFVYGLSSARTPTSGRALLREVRASFYRKLFLAFVAAAIVPVLALAFVTRAYIATVMFADIDLEASRTASVASRVVEDFASLQARGLAALPQIDDNVVVWLSRVIAQDVNIFDGATLLASSERNLFASGLLPERTPAAAYRAILLDGRPAYVGRERAGGLEYLVAGAPVRIRGSQAILMVPLTSRQQEIEGQIAELDRRVLLAALLFIVVGAFIGYSMAERIADPVNRLMRATRRIAKGDLDARIVATSSDELRRLVEAFNRMAADLQRQRAELERTNRLAAWAEMARQVAHDIKNPLTPIQLNAEHLRRVHDDRGRPLGGVIDDCVGNILQQVRLLRQISTEFSSFATSPQPQPEPVDPGAIVEEILGPYRAGLAGRVDISSRISPQARPVVVDRQLIGRALTNIIENALHAMPAGGRLVVSVEPDGPAHISIGVTDTGVGMDSAAVARIFEPYFSTKAIGTGLGLTIAKRNVEANGGTISVESTEGVGTTVTLRLPRS
jgi:signal transduction histidine kinase